MKVFISQKTNGRTPEEVSSERELVVDKIRKDYGESTIILNVFNKASPPNIKMNIPVWYLSESIKILSDADMIYFVNGSLSERGVLILKEIARIYGIMVVVEE